MKNQKHIAIAALTLFFLAAVMGVCTGADRDHQVPVIVTAAPRKQKYTVGEPLLVEVRISNGLKKEIGFTSFSQSPNSWNGETHGVSLYDTYRLPEEKSIFLARPKLDVPQRIEGPSRFPIKAGDSLIMTIDLAKWAVADGWIAGKYKVTISCSGIDIDDHSSLSVRADPIVFEILK